MPDACYYSIIERDDDGQFVGWIPDLPGVTAEGATEAEVLRTLAATARQCLRDLLMSGEPLPSARPAGELPPTVGARGHRRLLLIIS
jgi:predicted RNase H-like HicB family nuclease